MVCRNSLNLIVSTIALLVFVVVTVDVAEATSLGSVVKKECVEGYALWNMEKIEGFAEEAMTGAGVAVGLGVVVVGLLVLNCVVLCKARKPVDGFERQYNTPIQLYSTSNQQYTQPSHFGGQQN